MSSNQASADSVALMFFNDAEARTVEAVAERIIPGDGTDPGATEAGVVYYIDRAIAGFSTTLQRVYRLGLRELEELCRREQSASYLELTAQEQDEVVRRFLGPEVPQPEAGPVRDGDVLGEHPDAAGANEPLLRRFFAVLREHTVEGFFCDPVYGGNRGAVGWRLVGFPGAHWGYSEEQMAAGFDGRSVPIKTLSDLRSELAALTTKKNSEE